MFNDKNGQSVSEIVDDLLYNQGKKTLGIFARKIHLEAYQSIPTIIKNSFYSIEEIHIAFYDLSMEDYLFSKINELWKKCEWAKNNPESCKVFYVPSTYYMRIYFCFYKAEDQTLMSISL